MPDPKIRLPAKRILMVSNGYPPSAFGGVEVNSLELVRELKRRGHTLTIFCRDHNPQRSDYDVVRDMYEDVLVVRVVNDYKRVTSFRQLYADARIDAIFANLLDEFQPDIVHFNHFLALSATLPQATAGRGIATVATLHDYWPICQRVNLLNSQQAICPGPLQGGDCYHCLFVGAGERGKVVRWIKKVVPYNVRVWLRRAMRWPGKGGLYFPAVPGDLTQRQETFRAGLNLVQTITVPSQFVRSMLVQNGYAAECIQVAPLGIGLGHQPKPIRTNGLIRFGFVGSITSSKGVAGLMRAFRAVPGENIRLDIYGREDIHPIFAGQMRALAAGDPRIAFRGSFLPDQRSAIYAAIDVLVVPSVWHETFSLVAREALIAGIPVIAARVGALPEVVSEGVNGFLYPPGDEIALSTLIEQITQTPELIDQLQAPGPLNRLSIPASVDWLEDNYWNNYKVARNL